MKNILLFSLPIIVVNITVYFVLEKNYYSIYQKSPTVPNIYHSYILCDSHGLALGDNLEGSGVYNFSAASESYFDMYRKLNYLISTNNEIRQIIITADDHTLSFYREKFNNSDRSLLFVPYYDENDQLIPNRYEYIKQKYIQRYVPLLHPKTRAILKNSLKSLFDVKKNREKKWSETDNRRKISKIRADIQFQGEKQSEKLKKSLESIVKICDKNKISIIAIKFPLSGDYIKAVNGRSFGADKYIKNLGVNVYDFTNIYQDNDSLFQNEDHLNDEGGLEFSKVIKTIILR